ncbi:MULTISPECIES: hypothetical protein [Nostoc]|uniref:Secreted protein n=1 Tax=Nostoc paludosum FACHB-159 TaxID=2692908 RepID=A0ABR8JZ95_9NOSO|nr:MULTISPECIES: hypothetical protein [Nostoc]MBD2676259.1 hypothetical protein [Nostoc sp. FACHB-857]MBD2732613.1 hypothetical protein [Nostoc paludosum FACHB-159]
MLVLGIVFCSHFRVSVSERSLFTLQVIALSLEQSYYVRLAEQSPMLIFSWPFTPTSRNRRFNG